MGQTTLGADPIQRGRANPLCQYLNEWVRKWATLDVYRLLSPLDCGLHARVRIHTPCSRCNAINEHTLLPCGHSRVLHYHLDYTLFHYSSSVDYLHVNFRETNASIPGW